MRRAGAVSAADGQGRRGRGGAGRREGGSAVEPVTLRGPPLPVCPRRSGRRALLFRPSPARGPRAPPAPAPRRRPRSASRSRLVSRRGLAGTFLCALLPPFGGYPEQCWCVLAAQFPRAPPAPGLRTPRASAAGLRGPHGFWRRCQPAGPRPSVGRVQHFLESSGRLTARPEVSSFPLPGRSRAGAGCGREACGKSDVWGSALGGPAVKSGE